METPRQMTDVMQGISDILEHVVRLLDAQSQRIEKVISELARIKESQNQILAGFSLHERARRLEENLGLEQKDSHVEGEPGDSIEVYCHNCLRKVPIIDPTVTSQYGRTVIEGNCKNCRTKVSRILS